MANGNPFYVQPAGNLGKPLAGLAQAVGGLGQVLEGRREKQAQIAYRKEAETAVLAAVESRDPKQIERAMIKYPEFRDVTRETFGLANERTEAIVTETYRRIIADPERAEDSLESGIREVAAEGGQPTNMLKDLEAFGRDPEKALLDVKLGVARMDPALSKEWREISEPKDTVLKMGSGAMAGYSFDDATGEFSIQPEIQAMLDAKTKKMLADKKGDEFGFKEKRGISSDVTKLISSSQKIHQSTLAMEALRGSGSPAAQIAAVYTFMKALDEGSTVRTPEQEQVYEARGAAIGLYNKLNKLLSKGGLSDTGFDDLVDTARVLANRALSSTNTAVDSFLKGFGDAIPGDFSELQMKRIPGLFDIKKSGQGAALSHDEIAKRYHVSADPEDLID